MKTSSLFTTALLALATFAQAAPTEINYQGVLTDQSGNPVNGVRAMQLKIYDAPTGGTLLYSEDLGNVPVQDGIYSFSFGANGTSNALTTETVAIANGTVSTFQKVLTVPSVVAGSVTVTDGTYTWDPTNGSSNENDFSVAYSPNLRRVTVTYYNGAPAAGKTISAKFRAPGSGITGALAEDHQPWIEVSLAGVTQTPRQKLLTVPFALKARSIDILTLSSIEVSKTIEVKSIFRDDFVWNAQNKLWSDLPLKNGGGEVYDGLGRYQIPTSVRKINSISLNYSTFSSMLYSGVNSPDGYVQLTITNGADVLFTYKVPASRSSSDFFIPVDLELKFGNQYFLKVACNPANWTYGGFGRTSGGATLNKLSLDVNVSPLEAW